MATVRTLDLSTLYERDETARLESSAALAGGGRYAEMDYVHLSEYLADMARRGRREVSSRLVTLLSHLLKWERQPEIRSGSWRGTIREQRRELRQLLESGTLHNHAEAVLADAYASMSFRRKSPGAWTQQEHNPWQNPRPRRRPSTITLPP